MNDVVIDNREINDNVFRPFRASCSACGGYLRYHETLCDGRDISKCNCIAGCDIFPGPITLAGICRAFSAGRKITTYLCQTLVMDIQNI
ncbi:MAG: hypothetical protein GX639_11265 [Fibrobacter sp.]|nr:hypothetical protein [Fibrobacter sp.]